MNKYYIGINALYAASTTDEVEADSQEEAEAIIKARDEDGEYDNVLDDQPPEYYETTYSVVKQD